MKQNQPCHKISLLRFLTTALSGYWLLELILKKQRTIVLDGQIDYKESSCLCTMEEPFCTIKPDQLMDAYRNTSTLMSRKTISCTERKFWIEQNLYAYARIYCPLCVYRISCKQLAPWEQNCQSGLLCALESILWYSFGLTEIKPVNEAVQKCANNYRGTLKLP